MAFRALDPLPERFGGQLSHVQQSGCARELRDGSQDRKDILPHPAVLGLPGVDRVLGHTHFPGHFNQGASRLTLLQSGDGSPLR